VDVELTVDQEMFVADEVREAVKEALRHAFALAQRRLGQDVFLSEVYKVVENVTGVAHSTVTVNEDRNLRRLMTPDDTVQVLHTCTVRVLELAPTVPPAGAESPPPPGPLPGPARPIGARGSVVIDGIGTVYAQLLAAIYRDRDNTTPQELGDLGKYLDACGEVLDLLRGTLEQRLADSFPDNPLDANKRAAQPWLLPYFAQLVDVRLVSPDPAGQRDEVAQAVAWGQRKGTVACIEEIAESVG